MTKVSSGAAHSVPTGSMLLFLVATAFTVARASPAEGEPIPPLQFNVQVTSGSFDVLRGSFSEIRDPEFGPRGGGTLRGDGVELAGSGPANIRCEALGCSPGASVNLSTQISLAYGTVEGIRFSPFGFGGTVQGGFTLAFLSPESFTLPDANTRSISFRAPFTLTGSGGVPGVLPPPNNDDNPRGVLLLFNFSGTGTAVGTFSVRERYGSEFFFFENLHLDFADTAPVPEPGSLILLLTGLTTLGRRFTRKSDA